MEDKNQGPYFKGQKPSVCGHYFPDILRIRDDKERKMRILDCKYYGKIEVPFGPNTTASR